MLSPALRQKRGTMGTHVFVDAFTALLLIRPVPSKAKIGRSVVFFKRFVKTQTGRSVKILRSDFKNTNLVEDIRNECDNTGTRLQASAPYRKEGNGLAERGISLWLERTRVNLVRSNAPPDKFEDFARNYSAFQGAYKPLRQNEDGSMCCKADLFFGRSHVDLSKMLKAWGCYAVAKIVSPLALGATTRGIRGVFLGISPISKAF